MARTATVSNGALLKLLGSKAPLTAKGMGVSAVIAGNLREAGEIVRVGVVHKPEDASERRGRPAFLYRLNPDTRKRLRAEARKATRKPEKVAA